MKRHNILLISLLRRQAVLVLAACLFVGLAAVFVIAGETTTKEPVNPQIDISKAQKVNALETFKQQIAAAVAAKKTTLEAVKPADYPQLPERIVQEAVRQLKLAEEQKKLDALVEQIEPLIKVQYPNARLYPDVETLTIHISLRGGIAND